MSYAQRWATRGRFWRLGQLNPTRSPGDIPSESILNAEHLKGTVRDSHANLGRRASAIGAPGGQHHVRVGSFELAEHTNIISLDPPVGLACRILTILHPHYLPVSNFPILHPSTMRSLLSTRWSSLRGWGMRASYKSTCGGRRVQTEIPAGAPALGSSRAHLCECLLTPQHPPALTQYWRGWTSGFSARRHLEWIAAH